jgi:dipeptidyl aminopeptidase/acylaminoacyl peptidase
VGVVYEQDGLPEFHYFDTFYDRYQRSLEHALPGVVTSIMDVDRTERHLVVMSHSPSDPGTYYLLDTQTNTAVRIGHRMPWLDPQKLAEVRSLHVDRTDGAEVEAFVALPRAGGGRPPVVVLPHGGPIGVRDTRRYDPLVQFLAAGGLAVLQVNYRGSGGHGKSFLDAGKRQWGRGIEDDLEAALDAVIERGWVDPDRICVAGGSYGGYSALMSVIRRPDRYRCAASVNGPTDLLFAYETFFDRWEEGREYFEEFIGDPEDEEDLLSISPAYQAAAIRVPIFLVHGTEDRRVDVDHFYRMKAVLEALHRPHEVQLIQGAGHALSGSEWIELATRLRVFLLQNLGQRSGAAPAGSPSAT